MSWVLPSGDYFQSYLAVHFAHPGLELGDAIDLHVNLFRRIHRTYRRDFRAVDREDCHDYGLYVRAAEVFDKAFESTASLNYLNALLKCIDVLICRQHSLSPDDQGRLAWLILQERKHVGALAERFGVTIAP